MEETKWTYTKRRRDQIKDQINILDLASRFYGIVYDGGGEVASNMNLSKTFSTKEHTSLKLFPDTNRWIWSSKPKETETGEKNPQYTGDLFAFLANVVNTDNEQFKDFQSIFDYLYEMVPDKKLNPYRERDEDEIQDWRERFERQNNPYYKMSEDERKTSAEQLKSDIIQWHEYTGDNTVIDFSSLIPEGEEENSPKHLAKLDKELEDFNRKKTYDELAKNYFNDKTQINEDRFTQSEPNFFQYLSENRMINKEVLDKMMDAGLLYGTSWNVPMILGYDGKKTDTKYVPIQYCVFLNRNSMGDIENIDSHICSNNTEQYQNVLKHYKAPDGKGNGWMINFQKDGTINSLPDYDNKRSLCVFEANIDMLSYISELYEIGADMTEYTFFTSGGASKYQCILDRCKETSYKDVRICFDNDTAGIDNGKILARHLEEMDLSATFDLAYAGWDESKKHDFKLTDYYNFTKNKFNDWNEYRCTRLKIEDIIRNQNLDVNYISLKDEFQTIYENREKIRNDLLLKDNIKAFEGADKNKSKGIFSYFCKTKNIDYGIIKDLIANDMLRQTYEYGVKACIVNRNSNGDISGMNKIDCIYEEDAPVYMTNDETKDLFIIDKYNDKYHGISEISKDKRVCCFDNYVDMLSYMTVAKSKGVDLKEYAFVYTNDPQLLADTAKQYRYTFLCSKNEILEQGLISNEVRFQKHFAGIDESWEQYLKKNPISVEKDRSNKDYLKKYKNRSMNYSTEPSERKQKDLQVCI